MQIRVRVVLASGAFEETHVGIELLHSSSSVLIGVHLPTLIIEELAYARFQGNRHARRVHARVTTAGEIIRDAFLPTFVDRGHREAVAIVIARVVGVGDASATHIS